MPANPPPTSQPPSRRVGWRALALFWAVLLLALLAAGATLQLLGSPPDAPHADAPHADAPPADASHADATKAEAPHAEAAKAEPPRTEAAHTEPAPPPIARGPGEPIAEPDPDLLAPPAADNPARLPRIGAHGRTPAQAYAAGFDRADRSPRVALLLAGLGRSESDDTEALRLAPQITFALSPYAEAPDRFAAAARAAGHEVLLAIPMEPQGYPLNDPGPRALLTTQPPSVNSDRLRLALGQFAGYPGITNAMGGMLGERYSGTAAIIEVLREAATRGLFFLDARPGGQLPPMHGLTRRAVDVLVDEPPVSAEIVAALARLADLARARGNALGLGSQASPVALLRIAEWSNSLARQGLLLVPASAMMREGAK